MKSRFAISVPSRIIFPDRSLLITTILILLSLLLKVDAEAQSCRYKDGDGDGYGDPSVSCCTPICLSGITWVTNNSDCDDNNASIRNGRTWYKDADGDNYYSETRNQCNSPGSGWSTSPENGGGDCNDNNASINPNTVWYRDADGDGYGIPLVTTRSCTKPNGYVSNSSDCNDANAGINPNTVWYRDADGDGFGNGSVTTRSCRQPSGYVSNISDCNDGASWQNPNTTWYKDADNDGYYTSTRTQCGSPGSGWKTSAGNGGGDCNDSNSGINPNTLWYKDADGDGYYSSTRRQCTDPGSAWTRSSGSGGGDCNDSNSGINPNTTWYKDADGDGYYSSTRVQCADPGSAWTRSSGSGGGDCNDTDAALNPNTTWYYDGDGDGYYGSTQTSCLAPTLGWSTSPGNGQDCNDSNASLNAQSTWYRDADGDGYGNPSNTTNACTQPSGYVADNNDCNDGNVNINPNTAWYYDWDNDGYGTDSGYPGWTNFPIQTCDPSTISIPSNYQGGQWKRNDDDCMDSDPSINPDKVWYRDADGDGYGHPTTTTTSCEQPSGYVENADDCNDSNSSRNPNTVWYKDADGDGYYSDTRTQCTSPGSGWSVNSGNGSGDCDDSNDQISPTTTWYEDVDGDGYYRNFVQQCTDPGANWSRNTGNGGGDCNDDDATVNPGNIWYKDADDDGYYESTTQSCTIPLVQTGQENPWKSSAPNGPGDCDDNNPVINPGTIWYLDADNDGYYANVSSPTCTSPGAGWKSTEPSGGSGDCDDNLASVRPGELSINPLTGPGNVSGSGYCEGASIGLAALGGSNYTWYRDGIQITEGLNGNGSAVTITVGTEDQVYELRGLEDECSSEKSAFITIESVPRPIQFALSSSRSQVCSGTYTTITLADSELGANYQLYAGSNLQSGQLLAGTGGPLSWSVSSGTYSVKATKSDGSCEIDMLNSVSIGVSDPTIGINVVADPNTLNAPPEGSIIWLAGHCPGDQVTLQPINGSGFSWVVGTYNDNGDFVPEYTDDTNGPITVTTLEGITQAYQLTGNNSCGVRQTITQDVVGLKTVEFPSITSGDTERCINTTTSTYTHDSAAHAFGGYEWLLEPASAGSIDQNGVVTWNTTFTEEATVRIKAYGNCQSERTGSITVLPPINMKTAIADDRSLCVNPQTGLSQETSIWLSNFDDGIQYKLFKGGIEQSNNKVTSGNQIIWEDVTPGLYQVRASRPGGTCTTIMNGNLDIRLVEPSEMSIEVYRNDTEPGEISEFRPICLGEEITLRAFGGRSGYKWYYNTDPNSTPGLGEPESEYVPLTDFDGQSSITFAMINDTVRFKVEAYGENCGLLDEGFRTVFADAPSPLDSFGISGEANRCIDELSFTYNAFTDRATSYEWSVTPVDAGNINEDGRMTWNPGYTGMTSINVEANAACVEPRSASNPFVVTTHVLPEAIVLSAGQNELCPGETTSLTIDAVESDVTYQLKDGAGNPVDDPKSGINGIPTWTNKGIGQYYVEARREHCGIIMSNTEEINPPTNFVATCDVAILLNSPVEGASYEILGDLPIAWTGGAVGSDFIIDLHKGGSFLEAITVVSAEPTQFNEIVWSVPDVAEGDDYQVRIYQQVGSEVNEIISGNFSLEGCGIPTVQLPTDQNYVQTFTPRIDLSTCIQSKSRDEVSQNITYYDAIGRPIQEVMVQGSPAGNDLVAAMQYDGLGRQAVSYLPYVNQQTSYGPGHFQSTALAGSGNDYATSDQLHFYQNAANVASDAAPYAQTIFEPSPLNRVGKQGAAGTVWQPNSDLSDETDKVIRNKYDVNTAADAVWQWGVENEVPVPYVDYPAGTLYKEVIKDENGNPVITFNNMQGKTILKKVAIEEAINEWALTYYVYDDLENLRFVIQPEGVRELMNAVDAELLAADENFLARWTFSYTYDHRNRMIIKRVPGADSIFMVYDPWDRLVLTQDGKQRSTVAIYGTVNFNAYKGESYVIESGGTLTLGEGFYFKGSGTTTFTATTESATITNNWTFTKYDHLNRPVATGIVPLVGTREDVQFDLDSYYANTDGSSRTEVYSGDGPLQGYSNNAYPLATENNLLTVTYYDNYNFTSEINPPNTRSTAIGQVTGTKTRVLGESTWLSSRTYYDHFLRPVETISDHHLAGQDVVNTSYLSDVSALPISDTRVHTEGANTTTIQQSYTYDHRDRLLTHTQTLNGTSTQLSSNSYNEIGQLIEKNLGTDAQSVDFGYNIRGWLSGINGPVNVNGNDADDQFRMDIHYYNESNPNSAWNQYNGNIGYVGFYNRGATNTEWQSFTYFYDDAGRLTSDMYNSVNHANFNHFRTFGITYDHNGNIATLKRDHAGSIADDLSYTYVGNQLLSVTDGSGSTTLFDDGNTASDDYGYDASGNMMRDLNKGISQINYNYLNLPERVSFANGKTVSYLYNATGVKLQKTLEEGASTTVTDYITGIHYTNGALQFMQHAEGRVRKDGASWLYEYNLTDHLGNVRVTVDESGNVVQGDDYYPGGLTYNSYSSGTKNNYLYNQGTGDVTFKTERQPELGIDLTKYRAYDPALIRWWQIDPQAEKLYPWTPYNYGFNNPIRWNDPLGDCPPGDPNCNGGAGSIADQYIGGFTQFFQESLTAFKGMFEGLKDASGFNAAVNNANDASTLMTGADLQGNPGDRLDAGKSLAAGVVLMAVTRGKGKSAPKKYYRYMGKAEAKAVKETGMIPNVDRDGNLKDIYLSDRNYKTAGRAKTHLQLPNKPSYKVEVDPNNVSDPTMIGPVKPTDNPQWGVGGGTEATTKSAIPVDPKKIEPLKGGGN